MLIVIDSSLHGFITNQHDDQLPLGLLTQLVEYCISNWYADYDRLYLGPRLPFLLAHSGSDF